MGVAADDSPRVWWSAERVKEILWELNGHGEKPTKAALARAPWARFDAELELPAQRDFWGEMRNRVQMWDNPSTASPAAARATALAMKADAPFMQALGRWLLNHELRPDFSGWITPVFWRLDALRAVGGPESLHATAQIACDLARAHPWATGAMRHCAAAGLGDILSHRQKTKILDQWLTGLHACEKRENPAQSAIDNLSLVVGFGWADPRGFADMMDEILLRRKDTSAAAGLSVHARALSINAMLDQRAEDLAGASQWTLWSREIGESWARIKTMAVRPWTGIWGEIFQKTQALDEARELSSTVNDSKFENAGERANNATLPNEALRESLSKNASRRL